MSSQGRDIMFQKATSQGQADTTTAYVNINGAMALSSQTTLVNVQIAAPTQSDTGGNILLLNDLAHPLLVILVGRRGFSDFGLLQNL